MIEEWGYKLANLLIYLVVLQVIYCPLILWYFHGDVKCVPDGIAYLLVGLPLFRMGFLAVCEVKCGLGSSGRSSEWDLSNVYHYICLYLLQLYHIDIQRIILGA